MRQTITRWIRRTARPRESGWVVLLVLGGSVVAAVLLIQMGVAMAASAEPRAPHATRLAARPAQAPAAETPAVALVAQAR